MTVISKKGFSSTRKLKISSFLNHYSLVFPKLFIIILLIFISIPVNALDYGDGFDYQDPYQDPYQYQDQVQDPYQEQSQDQYQEQYQENQGSDLSIQVRGPDAANVGDSVTYQITVLNRGPGRAQAVSVNVPVPDGTEFVSADQNYDQYSGAWSIGDLEVSQSSSMSLTVRASTPSGITCTARATSSSNDINPGDESGSAYTQVMEASTDQASEFSGPDISNVVDNQYQDQDQYQDPYQDQSQDQYQEQYQENQGSDLSVQVSGPDTANIGDSVTYQITVTNNGPGRAQAVSVTVPVPAGTEFVSSDQSYDQSSGAWSVGDLEAAQSAGMSLTVKATAPPDITCSAQAASSSNELNPGDDSGSAYTQVNEAGADLSVQVSGPDTANIGDSVTYQITVTNNGPGRAQAVSVTVPVPAGTEFVSSDQSYDQSSGAWSVGDLEAAQSAGMSLTVKATAPPDITCSAQAASSSNELNPGDDSGSAYTQVNEAGADLSVQVSGPDTANIGDSVTYQITVTNNGPGRAQAVSVTVPVPAGTEFVSSDQSYDQSSGAWSVGDLEAAQSAGMSLTVKATAPPDITCSAQAASSSNELNPGDDSGSAYTQVNEAGADLSVQVSGPDTANIGDSVTYQITVTNNGPGRAQAVSVTVPVPAGTEFVSSDQSYDQSSGAWSVGDLEAAQSAGMSLTVKATAPPDITCSAQAASSSNELNPGDDSGSAYTQVNEAGADLSVQVSGPDTANIGDSVTYQITVTNNGPGRAQAVSVTVPVPAGTEFVSSDQSYDQSSGAWSVGDLEAAQSAGMSLTVKATAPPDITCSAQAASSSNELNPGDDSGSAYTQVLLSYASVSGTKFEDLNQNGQRDAEEKGLEGWTVNLEKDGSAVNTTTTDVNGQYSFDNLEPGDYVLAEVQQDGWTVTMPSAGSYQISLQPGQDLAGQDFGNFRPVEKASVSGTKFEDLNQNGQRDAEEKGLEGWTVNLEKDGVAVNTTTTDVNGQYSFDNLEPGDYVLAEVQQDGWTVTMPSAGSYQISLQPGQDLAGQDFGNFRPVEKASVSGTKFEDLNQNGLRDAEEKGLEGWTVNLEKDGLAVNTTTTDVNGQYSFDNLEPGDYVLAEVQQDGWTVTMPSAGSYQISLQPGQDLAGQDFGNFRPVEKASVSGTKFEDLNQNGLRDAEEKGLEGWTAQPGERWGCGQYHHHRCQWPVQLR